MTRRYPVYHQQGHDKMTDIPMAQHSEMTSLSHFHYDEHVGLECTPYQHSQRCTCSVKNEDQAHDDESLNQQRGQTLVPTSDASGNSWGQPRHSVSSYSACHYDAYGTQESLSLSSPTGAATFTAPQLPYRTLGNIHPHALNGSAPYAPRINSESLSESYSTHPAYLMSDLSGQTGPADGPLLGSSSPEDSSDGTASPPTPTGPSAGRREYGPHRVSRSDRKITFPDLELDHELNCNNEVVTPNIHASIERNIFFHDNQWTCYRRNYIFLQCHYSLTPCIPGAPLYVDLGGKDGKRMVQALGVSLSAILDGNKDGKGVELVQHTPKRDRGPQTDVGVQKLGPSPPGPNVPPYHGSTAASGPHLPLQSTDTDRSASMPPSGQHTFERIQFKQATANNGRRRAAQQFYHLSVELHADVRKDAKSSPRWIKIAHRISEPMVVRGRSPGHYQEGKGKSNSSSGSNGGGSTGGGSGPSQMFAFHGASLASRGYSMGMGGQGHSGMGEGGGGGGGGAYNSRQFMSPSIMTPSITSPMIASPTRAIIKHERNSMTSAEEAFAYDHDAGHRLFPQSVYETSGHHSHRPLVKIETGASTPNASAFVANDFGNSWHIPSCGRMNNFEASPAFYPSLGASF